MTSSTEFYARKLKSDRLLENCQVYTAQNLFMGDKFLNKHNQAFAKARSKEEIIKLASVFSWEFINLHPLPDANGRTARLLTSYILLAYGITPPFFLSDRAIQTTRKQWLEWFREGIDDSSAMTESPTTNKVLKIWADKIKKAAHKTGAAIKDEL